MKTKLTCFASGITAFLVGFGVWAVTVTVEKTKDHRASLPTMEQVGQFQLRNETITLYGFDFEGKRCIWMTKYKHAGLTCWDAP